MTEPVAAPEGKFRNPTPTVDCIVQLSDSKIVLIERKDGLGWALPGGFVDEGESLAHAAAREVAEETGLTVEITELFHCYSDPKRDPRKHTVSTVFIGTSSGAPTGSDDANRAGTFALDALPAQLAFDHATILSDFRIYLATGKRPPPDR